MIKKTPKAAISLETKCPPVPSLVNAKKPLPIPKSESPPKSFQPSGFCQKIIASGSLWCQIQAAWKRNN